MKRLPSHPGRVSEVKLKCWVLEKEEEFPAWILRKKRKAEGKFQA